MQVDIHTNVRRRRLWLTVVAALLAVAALASGAARLTFDNSTDAFFLSGDKTLQEYQRFRELFASDEYSLITLRIPELADGSFVMALREAEAELLRTANVFRVTSLASVRAISGGAETLDVRGYLEGVADEDLAERIRAATQHPYYRDLYISKDGRYAGMLVETAVIPGQIDYKLELRRRIHDIVKLGPLAAYDPTVVGAPILDADVRDLVGRESGLFGGLVFIIVAVGFYVVYRSWIAVAIPLLIAVLSIASAFGLMGWFGIPITLLTPILPSFLISVGVGSSIFLLTRYYQEWLRTPESGAGAVRRSIHHVRFPCMLASLTTIGALFAFSASDIAPVRDIGIVLGLGLTAALLLTFTFGAAVLELLAPRVSPAQGRRIERRGAWLEAVDRLATRYRYVLLGSTLTLTAIAAVGVTKLQLDYYYLGTFKESTPIRQDYEKSDARLPSSAAIEVVLSAPAETDFRDPELLRRLERIQEAISQYQALPAQSYSLVNVVKEINEALHEGQLEAYRIPDRSDVIAQGLLLFESSGSDETTRLASPDYRMIRLTVQLPTVPQSQSAPLREYIENSLAQHFQGSGVHYTVTGIVPMWMEISDYLRSTQIESVLLAFGVACAVLLVYTRSLTVGLTLVFVNVSVVILVLGFMVLMGWPLDPYTVLIADIAIGILDDDTIHFFSEIKERMQAGAAFDEAVSAARSSAGQSMYYLALCLIAGFSVYLLSSIASLAMFGALVALVIFIGLIWECLVMPAYLSVLHHFGLFRVSATQRGSHAHASH